jgi:hypothetical protein
MRVLLSTYGGRGDVEPLVGLAVRLRALGAEVRVCAPPDCAERLAEVGVPLVPVGAPVRPLVHGATPPSAADVPRRAACKPWRPEPTTATGSTSGGALLVMATRFVTPAQAPGCAQWLPATSDWS